MKHIISAQQFSKTRINDLIEKANSLEKNVPMLPLWIKNTKSCRVVNFFCEPSTRTRISFDAAAQSLGQQVLTIADKEGSSINKGETLDDSIKTLGRYSDCIVLRHGEAGAAHRASCVSSVPIINAGDGDNEHPTQALLDLFTISKKMDIEGVKVLIVGDLKYGRTVHSLIPMLHQYGAKIYVASDRQLALPPELQSGVIVTDMGDGSPHPRTSEVLKTVDVVYMTRVQKERVFGLDSGSGTVMNPHPITINPRTIELMQDDAIVMHPGPRNNEISSEVDDNPRMAMFDQAENGLYMRMAILNEALGLNMV